MTTILIVLTLLLLPVAIGGLLQRGSQIEGAARLGGVVGLSLAFLFFASGHFVMTRELAEMIPAWIPGRHTLVVMTGFLEIGIAAGLASPRSRRLSGFAAASVLIMFFPANVYAALNAVGPGGHQWGPEYLLVRGPLQLFLLFWTYRFTLAAADTRPEQAEAARRGIRHAARDA